MAKHAFLIMAHKELSLLNNLICCLDDSRNDLFIHIDVKSKINIESIVLPGKANICFVDRKDVSWGGDTQIIAELELMKAAIKKEKYDYYHLISGQDLPLKNQREFHDFFEKNKGKSFVDFDSQFVSHEQFVERVGRYYFLQNRIGRNTGYIVTILNRVQKLSIMIQKFFGIDRTIACPYKLYKGTNWFSITDELVRYLISKEIEILKCFSNTFCADEIFLQTILNNSPFSNEIVNESLREIDWERGTPYIYTIDDLDVLLSSSKMFGRKFSAEKDNEIIKEICKISGVSFE